jgi:hypothetical protein
MMRPGSDTCAESTIRPVRYLPNVLLVLALPAGVFGYALGSILVGALSLSNPIEGFFVLFIPLLIGGLCMVPFIIPFIDRRAKADLAAYRRTQEGASGAKDEPEA